ncbi:unnamed protein product [Fusarium graminearum]|nr:unnamed protein product [Fusarium graminearum]
MVKIRLLFVSKTNDQKHSPFPPRRQGLTTHAFRVPQSVGCRKNPEVKDA